MTKRPVLLDPIALVVSVVLAIVWIRWFPTDKAVDLWPVLAAGHFFRVGGPIYQDGALFDLSTPEPWRAFFDSTFGEGVDCFPFVYPPLWAWFFSWFPAEAADTLATVVYTVNPILAVACLWATWSIAGRRESPALWVGLGGLVCFFSTPLYFGLQFGQFQIPLTFLVLAGIERERHGWPVLAGALLALAASIKLYPAAFALYWLVRRRWTAVGAFAAFGLLLGLASLFVGGIELHRAFLHTSVGRIGATVYHHPFNHSVGTSLAVVFAQLGWTGLDPDPTAVLSSIAKPRVLGWLDGLLLVGFLGVSLRWAARVDEHAFYRRVWPTVLIGLSLVGPLAWLYYGLAALFFLPLLGSDPRMALLTLFPWLLISPFGVIVRSLGGSRAQQVAGTLAFGILALLYAFNRAERDP